MTTLVGTATASATTVTVPAHQAGDLILIFAMHGGSGTLPTVPTGYTLVLAKANGTVLGTRSGYKIATSSSDTSGTWTNATEICCHVYRPAAGNVLAIGASAFNSSTTNTVNYPALTLLRTDGTSWVAGFAACGNTSETISTPPSGMTNESSITGASYAAAGHDTEGGVSSWSSTSVTTTGTAVASVSNVIEIMSLPSGSVPTQMVQHVGGGGNPYTRGNTGNAFKLPFPNATGAGNCLVLGFTCDAGATISSVADNINGTWGAATASSSGGVGNLDSYVYVFPNSGSGQVTITVTFGAAVRVFGSCMTEFYGVATSSPVSAHSSAAYSTTIATGSLTPGSNNSIVWAYFCKAEGSGIPAQLVSTILPSTNFTLLDADIGWNNANDSLTHASEIYLQPTAAAINPGLTVTSQTTDHWNSLGIALTTSGGAGTAPPAGIRIVKVLHFASEHFASGYKLQLPSIGNLRCICSDDPSLSNQTITDNEGNTWSGSGSTGVVAGTGFWYQANSQVNSSLFATLTGGGSDTTLSWRYIDIIGADPSPYDNAGTINVTDTLNGLSSFTASRLPAPTSSKGLTIANIGLGQGPGLAVTAPSGAIWDLALYTGETDLDLLENADIMAHYKYTASGSQTWTFTITNQASNSDSGGFISFKEASLVTLPPGMQLVFM